MFISNAVSQHSQSFRPCRLDAVMYSTSTAPRILVRASVGLRLPPLALAFSSRPSRTWRLNLLTERANAAGKGEAVWQEHPARELAGKTERAPSYLPRPVGRPADLALGPSPISVTAPASPHESNDESLTVALHRQGLGAVDPTAPAPAELTSPEPALGSEKFVILWDIDNVPHQSSVYDAAVALRKFAKRRGTILDFTAYGKSHSPKYPPEEYSSKEEEEEELRCPVCNHKCASQAKLDKHYNELHRREHVKLRNRAQQLSKKSKKKALKFLAGKNGRRMQKYDFAEMELTGGTGWLDTQLRRAGCRVRDVSEDGEVALRKCLDLEHVKGATSLLLVSDQAGEAKLAKSARDWGLSVMVIGTRRRSWVLPLNEWKSWGQIIKNQPGKV